MLRIKISILRIKIQNKFFFNSIEEFINHLKKFIEIKIDYIEKWKWLLYFIIFFPKAGNFLNLTTYVLQ